MRKYLILLFTVIAGTLNVFSATNEIVVSKSGDGDYTTIQAAINSIAENNTEWVTILIKNGVYDEHVMIKNNFIALVGEDRYLTRIEHNLSRTAWKNGDGGGKNTGCGVINIWTDCHDIIIGNMTVKNTYNYDSNSGEDYTEVLRTETGTTRIWTINTDFLCKWKDTFAPWGKENGMYYVADCHIRGSIDAFCPRGWCYAINCRFTETRDSSPIWLEGVAGLEQKLVVQGGSVHSEKNTKTKLQNQQGSPSFYYLDVLLSDSIGSQGSSGPSYYYNVKGNASYSWFNNSIALDKRKEIDALWTFKSKDNVQLWDPENTMPSVFPFASMPQPYDGRYAMQAGAMTLRWTPARDAVKHKVYFGTTEQPELWVETTERYCETPAILANQTYYWKVNTVTSTGEIQGNVWRFTTSDNIEPITQASFTLTGKSTQSILMGNPIEDISYTLIGATEYQITGLPQGVTHQKTDNVITISGTPEALGTFNYKLESLNAIANATTTGTIIVREEGDPEPEVPVDVDYTSTRLDKFITTLDCTNMPQNPAWVVSNGSVSASNGTGYKWGSTSASITVKVRGCARAEFVFTHSNVNRPILLSDGGSGNSVSLTPSAANAETTASFYPASTGDADIVVKTSGSSGMVVKKIILYGVGTSMDVIEENPINYQLLNGILTTTEPVDIFDINGKKLYSQVQEAFLSTGFFILKKDERTEKIINY